jgi:hypothetical protein
MPMKGFTMKHGIIVLPIVLLLSACGSTIVRPVTITKEVTVTQTVQKTIHSWNYLIHKVMLTSCEKVVKGSSSTCECAIAHMEAKESTEEVMRTKEEGGLYLDLRIAMQSCENE